VAINLQGEAVKLTAEKLKCQPNGVAGPVEALNRHLRTLGMKRVRVRHIDHFSFRDATQETLDKQQLSVAETFGYLLKETPKYIIVVNEVHTLFGLPTFDGSLLFKKAVIELTEINEKGRR